MEAPTSRSSLTPCILDDEPEQLNLLSEMISELGYESLPTSDPEEALRLVQSGACRLILADVHRRGVDEYEFLDRVLRVDPGVHVIIVSKEYTLESALEAIRRGATDFLPKPLDRIRLKRALDDVAALYDQRRRVRALEEQLLRDLEFHGIVGKSPVMLEVFDFARKVARHYTNVLLVGPTGTGKELVARAIHQLSPVSQQRLAVCNCSAMVDTLLESQLFGHMRGAFTGATEMRPGLFEYANGGTVFLDEVGETSLAMQAKLLRVIQNREVQRVGSPEVRHVNVRLIAATNRDLRAEVLAGRFREDLFYRLSSIQIRIPSLMERLEDIPLLVHFFCEEIQPGVWEKYFRAYAEGTDRVAAACVAGECAGTGKCGVQRRDYHQRGLHRSLRPAGKFAASRATEHRGTGVAAAVAGRSAQSAYPAGVADVHGKPVARGAGAGYRADQFVPLFEAGSGGVRGAGQTCAGRRRGRCRIEALRTAVELARTWSSCSATTDQCLSLSPFTATSRLLLTLLIA